MVESAITGAGLTLVGGVGGYKLPPGMANPCGDGTPWINQFDNLWLSVNVTGSRRWVQTVTEQYKLALYTPLGADEASRVISRESTSFEVENSRVDDWENSEPDAGTRHEELTDEERRVAALTCLLNRANTTLIGAHRGTTLNWQVPTDMALAIDLVHTLELSDRAKGRGKCRRIQHVLDLGAGTAITTLSVAIMQGAGVSDPLTLPAAPDTSLPPMQGGAPLLGTHIGGRPSAPPYDENWMGFTGNYSFTTSDNTYPRQFKAQARDIPADYRDERTATAERSYRVGIPNDLLEL
jgi:hypothetical protein